MVSRSKKVVALLLTAMMAAGAMAGCGGGTTQPSQPSQASQASQASQTSQTEQPSQASASDVSAVDLESPEIIQRIKDKIAEEAAKTGNVVSMLLWCASDDKSFEEGLMKEFQEKYADSRYTFKIKPQSVGENDAGGKILAGPKDGADVFSFADDQLYKLVKAGAIAQVADLFNNNVIKENTADAVAICTVDGASYAFPKTSDNGYFMYYDKRIFSAEDVQSMDTMIEKAKAAGKAVYFPMTDAWYSAGFFFAAGCNIKYENDKQTAEIGNENGVSAVKAMCHIAENVGDGFEGTPGSVGNNPFITNGFNGGTLAAAVTGTWNGPAIKKAIGEENVGAAKLPTVLMNGEQVQLNSFSGYKLIGVNAYSAYPITAQALAYYLGKAESQVRRYQVRGLIPTATAALEDEQIKNDPARVAIAAQLPFSHGQSSSVGGTFWNSGTIADYGGVILNAKGKLDDAKILEDLKTIEAKY